MVRAIHLGPSCRVPFCIAEPNAQPPRHMKTRGSHCLSHSKERAALILATVNPKSRPPVESSSHPRISPPRPLPPPDADQRTLTPLDPHNSDRQHIRALPPPVETDRTGGQSEYSLLPPVLEPHRSTPLALSHTPITFSGRRSISAPAPLPNNAVPQRTSLLQPPPPPRALLCCPLPLLQTADIPKALTVATCACRIVARCGSICVSTTIYFPSKERLSVSVAVVITT